MWIPLTFAFTLHRQRGGGGAAFEIFKSHNADTCAPMTLKDIPLSNPGTMPKKYIKNLNLVASALNNDCLYVLPYNPIVGSCYVKVAKGNPLKVYVLMTKHPQKGGGGGDSVQMFTDTACKINFFDKALHAPTNLFSNMEIVQMEPNLPNLPHYLMNGNFVNTRALLDNCLELISYDPVVGECTNKDNVKLYVVRTRPNKPILEPEPKPKPKLATPPKGNATGHRPLSPPTPPKPKPTPPLKHTLATTATPPKPATPPKLATAILATATPAKPATPATRKAIQLKPLTPPPKPAAKPKLAPKPTCTQDNRMTVCLQNVVRKRKVQKEDVIKTLSVCKGQKKADAISQALGRGQGSIFFGEDYKRLLNQAEDEC